ncbi:glycoside hydrolase superfamily [Xylariomycetidae sp. FL0641]|nr:glycoside hydrolase superfamily [Xylariomycetidae sp. FL0641]
MAHSRSSLLALLATPVYGTLFKTDTPPMGWNSYNYYACNPTEDIIKSNAQGLVDLGLADLGYKYVTTDCGWMTTDRDSEDRLQWNTSIFPSGGQALGDYLHGLELKFGLYSGAGYYQCGSTDLPASLGYEEIDAETFAGWGGDSLKYDNCYPVSPDNMVDYDSAGATSPERHQKMATELDSVDRDMAYFICQWGIGTNVEEWAPPIGDTYRISNDIYNSWRNVWRITNQVAPFWRSTGPGSYPDMDILIVGLHALSLEEEKFHFGMWAIQKSPLTIGAPTSSDLTPSDSLNLLANEEVIALNQDALGQQARLVRRYTEEEWDVWAGDLADNKRVLGIANWRNDSQSVTVDLAATLNISSAAARDVWAHEDLGLLSGAQTLDLEPHELRLLVLSNITAADSAPEPAGYYTAATDAALANGATTLDCATCTPAASKVGLAGSGGDSTATFSGVAANSAGTKLLGVDFVNYELATSTSWDWGSNTRNMTVAVNGGAAKRWAFPISGGNWTDSDRMMIEVDGFEQGDSNEVVFGMFEGSPTPDLVGFEVFE